MKNLIMTLLIITNLIALVGIYYEYNHMRNTLEQIGDESLSACEAKIDEIHTEYANKLLH